MLLKKYTLLITAIIVVFGDLIFSIYYFSRSRSLIGSEHSNNLINSKTGVIQNPLIKPNNTLSKITSSTVKVSDDLSISQKTADEWKQLLKNVPSNPNRITATSVSKGRIITVTSGKSYPYDNVTFYWSGARANEPGTTLKGYYVYFGPNSTEIPFPNAGFEKSVNPKSQGIYVTANSYTFSNLKKGQVYYLYIQSYSDSKNPNIYYRFGMEQVEDLKTLSAKKLFVYKYE